MIPDELHDLESSLARHGTQLLVVVLPKGRGEAVAELPHYSVVTDGTVSDVNFEQDRQRSQNLERAYASSGVRTLGLQGPIQRSEEASDRAQLFNAYDIHLTPAGQIWVGRAILDELERWRPWSSR